MFERTVRAARSVGLDTHSWYLMPGSRTNGNMWRLFSRPGGGTALGGLDRGFLGMTAREARDTLHAFAVAWETVADSDYLSELRAAARLYDEQLLSGLGETNQG